VTQQAAPKCTARVSRHAARGANRRHLLKHRRRLAPRSPRNRGGKKKTRCRRTRAPERRTIAHAIPRSIVQSAGARGASRMMEQAARETARQREEWEHLARATRAADWMRWNRKCRSARYRRHGCRSASRCEPRWRDRLKLPDRASTRANAPARQSVTGGGLISAMLQFQAALRYSRGGLGTCSNSGRPRPHGR
jgi:hypothetical protein